MLKWTQKDVNIGSKPKGNLYDMQVSYNQEENTILQTTQLLYNQKLAVLQLINVKDVNPDDVRFSAIKEVDLSQNQPGNVVNPFWTQINDNKNHYIGLRFSMPIFNGFKTSRNVQLAKLEFQKKNVEAEQEKIKLRQLIEQETAKKYQNETLH